MAKGEIINYMTGEKIIDFKGIFEKWSSDGRFFLTSYTTDFLSKCYNFTIWDASNFSKIQTIPVNKYNCQITFSPDGTKIAFVGGRYPYELTVVNYSKISWCILQNNFLDIEVKYISFPDISWSLDDKICFFCKIENTHELFTFNFSNESSFEKKTMIGENNRHYILSSNCEKYVGLDYYNGSAMIFNKSGLINVIEFESNNPSVFTWSDEKDIIAMGNMTGIIEMRNTTNGEVVNKLETPIRKIRRSMPFPSVTYLISIFLVLAILWKEKNKSR